MSLPVKELPYHSLREWIEAGYLWRELHCGARGCGLPVIAFYLTPGGEELWVDPVTHLAHVAVCGDRGRVLAFHMREDADARPGADWKSRAANDR